MIDFVLVAKIDDSRRQTLLEQTLRTFHLTVPSHLVNRFVLLDDCSTMLNASAFPFPIQCITNEKQLGVGGSKNKGVELHTKHGRGKLLYMFDADVYFTPEWLNWLLYLYDTHHERFKIIAGGVHPFLQPREGEGTQHMTSHDAISGWSWLLDYATWDKYGKLADNALGTGKSEDWEYCQRIRKEGYLVGCSTPQVVAHCGMTNSEGLPIPGKEVSEELAKRVAPLATLL